MVEDNIDINDSLPSVVWDILCASDGVPDAVAEKLFILNYKEITL